jgi:hypothetical protein
MPTVRRWGKAAAERSPRVKSLGRRVLGAPDKKRRPSPAKPKIDIRGGHMMLDTQRGRWPIVVVVALGLQPGDTEAVADLVERAQLTSGRFRPLFLVDSGELGPFRARSYAVETVMRPDTYARVNPQDSYAAYVYERTESICAAYGVRAVVPLSREAVLAGDVTTVRLIGAFEL